MNDEKTTEIEIPSASTNIVRVNFVERRKVSRVSVGTAQAQFPQLPPLPTPPPVPLDEQWTTPWWVRVAALVAILALSLFVL